MPWTNDDFLRGSDDIEMAITGSRPRAERWQHQDDTILVAPREDHWIVGRPHSKRVIAAFHTRDQAITRARQIAAELDAEVVIHDHLQGLLEP